MWWREADKGEGGFKENRCLHAHDMQVKKTVLSHWPASPKSVSK